MARQQALKALIQVSDDSEEETNMSSGVKNPATQVPSPAASMSVSRAGGGYSQPVGNGIPSPATSSGCAFANTQDASMYEEFINADKEM